MRPAALLGALVAKHTSLPHFLPLPLKGGCALAQNCAPCAGAAQHYRLCISIPPSTPASLRYLAVAPAASAAPSLPTALPSPCTWRCLRATLPACRLSPGR